MLYTKEATLTWRRKISVAHACVTSPRVVKLYVNKDFVIFVVILRSISFTPQKCLELPKELSYRSFPNYDLEGLLRGRWYKSFHQNNATDTKWWICVSVDVQKKCCTKCHHGFNRNFTYMFLMFGFTIENYYIFAFGGL